MRPNLLTILVRFLAAHRRGVAALAAMLAAGALGVVASGRDEGAVPVVTAVRHVDAGQALTAADVTLTAVPAQYVPDGALTDPAQAVGRLTVAPLPRGGIVTADALVAATGRAATPGRLILLIPVNPADLAGLLQPGQAVTLLLSDGFGTSTLVDDVTIVGFPEAASTSLFGSSAATVLVDVTEATAELLAGAGSVTIALR
jgi:Flp pilus assembly protein CpaB